MRKSRIQKLAIACIAACAVLGGIGATNAQMHDGSRADGGGFHGGGGFHDGDRFHGRVFIGPPIIFGPGYYPYNYSYPYADDSSSYQWYCGDPSGYYPDVQTCPSGWLQVVPNG